MSPREKLQTELVDWLETTSGRWTAPYGILPGLESLPKGGKVRTVTFGVARYLDATIYIWSVNKITIRAQGSLAYNIDGRTWESLDELISDLAKV